MKKYMSLFLAALMLILSLTSVAVAEPDLDYYNRTISIDASYEDGAVSVYLVDSEGGSMSNWPISLIVNGETVANEHTDYDGTYTFEYDFTSSDHVVCFAESGGFDEFTFTGTEQEVDVSDAVENEEDTSTSPENEENTTTTEGESAFEETETTSTESAMTSVSSEAESVTTTMGTLVQSSVTTAVNGEKIAVGIDADRSFLTNTQLTADEFVSKARMWMNASLYNDKIENTTSTLHLQLNTNAQAGDMAILLDAKNRTPAFSSYTDDQVKGFAVDMNVVYIDGDTRVPIPFPDDEYLLELPVPLTMRNCKKIAVAACSDSGCGTLTEVPVKNGLITFKVKRIQTMAIVGLGDRGAVFSSLTQTPTLLWGFIIVGILLIVGGAFLLIFVSFRKKNGGVAAKSSSAVITKQPDDVERISLAKEEVVAQNRQEPTDVNVAVQSYVDESITESEGTQPTKESPVVIEQSVENESLQEDASLNDMLDDMLNDLDGLL
ncbi:MAG: hypothetical protein IKV35_04285 [Clostridia bacterium]|nr:hypothetical protein [Clostridia bacterium]